MVAPIPLAPRKVTSLPIALEDVLHRVEVGVLRADHHPQLAAAGVHRRAVDAGVERPVAGGSAARSASSRAKSGGIVLMSTT